MKGLSFDINRSIYPPSCLPAGLDKSSLIDVTCVGNAWRVYLDTVTGETHDGAVYYEELRRTLMVLESEPYFEGGVFLKE